AYGFMGVLPGVILADAYARSNRRAEALKVIARMLDESSTPEVGIFISEVWRLRGELALAETAAHKPQAEQYLRTAVRIASSQAAKIYLSRAEESLARL